MTELPLDIPISPASATKAALTPLLAGAAHLALTPTDEVLVRNPTTRQLVQVPPSNLPATLVAFELARLIGARGEEAQPVAVYGAGLRACMASHPAAVRLSAATSRHAPFWLGDCWGDAPPGVVTQGGDFPPLPVDTTYPHIRELWSGVHCDERTRHLLTILTAVAVGRAGLPEFPLVVIDASGKNTGKTRVGRALQWIVAETDVVVNDLARLNQQLGGMAWRPGPNLILFDNLTGKIFSSHLSSAVHGEHLDIEPKYMGLSRVFYPVVVATINQARLEHDLSDKCIVIRLERPADLPVDAPAIMRPDPLTYAHQHRLAIFAEARHILRMARPPARDAIEAQTRFVDWERAMAGAAAALRLPLSLHPPEAESVDQLAIEVVRAIEAFHDTQSATGPAPTAQDLLTIIRGAGRRMGELNYWLDSRSYGSDVGAARGLTALLRGKVKDRILTVDGVTYHIELTEERPVRFLMTRKEES